MVTSNSIACNSILIFLHSCSNLEDYRYCKNTEKFIYSFSLRFPPKKVKTYRVEVILSEIWGLHLTELARITTSDSLDKFESTILKTKCSAVYLQDLIHTNKPFWNPVKRINHALPYYFLKNSHVDTDYLILTFCFKMQVKQMNNWSFPLLWVTFHQTNLWLLI